MCCGSSRAASSYRGTSGRSGARTSAGTSPGGQRTYVVFQYTGRTRIVAVGVVTGRQYRFGGPGARLSVDIRDARSLTKVPNLRHVRV